MAKKIVREFVFWLCIAALALSTSRGAMAYLSNARDQYKKDTWWGVHQNTHGDLASMAHLDYLDKFNMPRRNENRRAAYNGRKNTVLYLHGDSNCLGLGDSVFAGVCKYIYVGWSNPCRYHLDTTKNNILVIEIGERILNDYFNTTQIIDQLHDTGAPQPQACISAPFSRNSRASVLPDAGFDCLFNKYINQNLEFNLFNYNFMMPMFGFKAAINLYMFDRASGDVVISKDKQFLFFKETVSPTTTGSSYAPIPDGEIDRLMYNLNVIYDYYKASGFREVYFSVIPNTATIMQPEGYNKFIPILQNDKRLKMKVIDVYSVMKRSSELLFTRGDTHWNAKGRQLWIDMVNEELIKTAK